MNAAQKLLARRVTDPEDVRKVEYLKRQLADKEREADHAYLSGTLDRVLRRYA